MNFRLKLACSIVSVSAAVFAFEGVKAQGQTPRVQAENQVQNIQSVEQTPNTVAQFNSGGRTRSGSS